MIKDDGQFKLAGHLGDFTQVAQSADHQDRSLDLVSSGTRQTLIQAGAELPATAKLDLTAEAKIEFNFEKSFEYVLKAPNLKGQHITNLLRVASDVQAAPGWQHSRFYIVHEIYEAEQFTFLGTQSTKRKIAFTGSGAGILGLLTAGASAGLQSSGNVEVKILGQGGALAMNLVRVKRDGQLDYVT